MDRPLDNLQRHYFKQYETAIYHFIAKENELGLDILVSVLVTPNAQSDIGQFHLLLQPDLSVYLRALLNVNVLEYATVRRCPGKPRLLAEYYTLLDIIVEDMGKDHHSVLHLRECFDNIKDDLDIPIGRASVEVASDGQKKTGDESLDEVFEDAMEGLKIESPAAPPESSLPPLSSTKEDGDSHLPTSAPTSDAPETK